MLSGQYTISDKILPTIGDTSYFVSTPDRIPIHMMEKNRAGVWDYSILSVPYATVEVFESAAKGKHFTEFKSASLVLKKINGEEHYFRIDKGSLLLVGKVIFSPAARKGFFVVKFIKPKLILKTPVKISQTDKREELLQITVRRTELMENWQKYFPATVDSVMWEVHRKADCEAKEAGYLIFHGEGYQVQFSESIVQSTYKIKIKNKGKKNWVNFPLDTFKWPEEIKNLWFSNDYTQRDFYSEQFKGAVLSYKISSEGMFSDITFQIKDSRREVPLYQGQRSEVISFPNPAFGTLYFSLLNYPSDNYSLEVYNVIGKVIYSQSLSNGIGNRYKIDLGHLRKGTYMYSILDSKGNKLTTKRFALVTP